jgi:hypothetical protein
VYERALPSGAPFFFAPARDIVSLVRSFVVALALAGCLDAGNSPASDLSGSVADLAPPPDQLRGDAGDGGGPYNCSQLNTCERACKNGACVAACRAMATASAVTKEAAVQACFNRQCPQSNDGGSAICMPDGTGAFSTACQTCISNTQVPANMTCANNAPECHACLTQVADCKNDV